MTEDTQTRENALRFIIEGLQLRIDQMAATIVKQRKWIDRARDICDDRVLMRIDRGRDVAEDDI